MKSKGPKIFGTSAISSIASQAQQQQLNNTATPMPGSLGGGSAISTIAGMFGKRQKKQTPQGMGASGIQGEAIDTMVGNSRGMMMKSPLKEMGAYESGGLNEDGIDESVKSEDITGTINDAVDTAATAATDVIGQTKDTPKKEKSEKQKETDKAYMKSIKEKRTAKKGSIAIGADGTESIVK